MVHPHDRLQPSPWVMRWTALLPAGTAVLDLASGSGRHARPMAQRGLAVTAVDRDEASLDALRAEPGVVEVVAADVENRPWPLDGRRFGAIVITNYLWRPLWPALLESLAPGGLLIHETFSVDHASIGKPSNPDFLLRHGELLEVCRGLRVLGYEDGFIATPDRFVQRIAALRPQAAGMSATPRRYPL